MKRFLVVLTGIMLATMCLPAEAWKQDEFLVTFWCAPPVTDTNLTAVASEGYNLTQSPASGLDTVARHGLKALLQDDLLNTWVMDSPSDRTRLDALIDSVKNHPALAGYYITDEPDASAFPGLGRLVAYIKKRDPNHFAYINLFPTYATEAQLGVSTGVPYTADDYQKVVQPYKEHLRRYSRVVKPELISYDHYHFYNGRDGLQYFLNLALIREAAVSTNVPFLNIIQACTFPDQGWRMVDKEEVRWLVFTTLAYGGRGISYFLYWGPKEWGGLYQDGVRTPLALDVAAINAELKTIGPEMMKLKSVAAYHTAPLPLGGVAIPQSSPVQITSGGGFVLGLFSSSIASSDTFMIVNRDYNASATATLSLATNVTALSEFNRTSGTWQSVAYSPGNPVSVALQPGNGRLFRMTR